MKLFKLVLPIFFLFFCMDKKDLPDPEEPGLIAHYSFNGNANDLTPYANNGTVYNASLTIDSFGAGNSAYLFNSSYIEIKDNDVLDMKTNQLTLSAWIKPLSTSGSYIIHKGQYGQGGGPYCLDIFPGKARAILYSNNLGLILEGNTPVKRNVWQHVAVTWDGKQAHLYYNGQVEASGAFEGLMRTDEDVYIGAYKWAFPSASFKGTIDNMRIYNKALSTSEIQNLFQSYN